jgi:hypothetical protein
MSLTVCARCRGFVPSPDTRCPHCAISARTGRALWVGAIALGATLAVGICVPACAYGDFSPDPGPADASVDSVPSRDGGIDASGGVDAAPDSTVR